MHKWNLLEQYARKRLECSDSLIEIYDKEFEERERERERVGLGPRPSGCATSDSDTKNFFNKAYN